MAIRVTELLARAPPQPTHHPAMRLLSCLFLALSTASSVSETPPRVLDDSSRQALSDLPRIGDADKPQRDRKIVNVTFPASWCPPCRWEFEVPNTFRLKFDKKFLAIVAINLFEHWDQRNAKRRIDRFLTSTRPDLSLVFDEKAVTKRFGGIDRIPTLFGFDRSGREASSFVQLEGPKKIHARDSELTRGVEKLH